MPPGLWDDMKNTVCFLKPGTHVLTVPWSSKDLSWILLGSWLYSVIRLINTLLIDFLSSVRMAPCGGTGWRTLLLLTLSSKSIETTKHSSRSVPALSHITHKNTGANIFMVAQSGDVSWLCNEFGWGVFLWLPFWLTIIMAWRKCAGNNCKWWQSSGLEPL